MTRYEKIRKKIALIGVFIVAVMFIGMVVIGLFFSDTSLNLFVGMIVATTIFVVLIYAMLMFLKMKEKSQEKMQDKE